VNYGSRTSRLDRAADWVADRRRLDCGIRAVLACGGSQHVHRQQFSDQAVRALKYMVLAKIMDKDLGDIAKILNAKNMQGYAHHPEIEAVQAVAQVYRDRNMHAFEKVLEEYSGVLKADTIVSSHLDTLYDMLFEGHLLRLVEPYRRTEVAHIASQIDLPAPKIEAKLCQMILDKKLYGVLDVGKDGETQLICYDDQPSSQQHQREGDEKAQHHSVPTTTPKPVVKVSGVTFGNEKKVMTPAEKNVAFFESGLKVLEHMSAVVDALNEKHQRQVKAAARFAATAQQVSVQ